MKILAVDDEQLMLDALTNSIRTAAPNAEVFPFKRSSAALEFAEFSNIDVAFLDINMRGMNGLELGRKLIEIHPEINLIFVTSYEEYVAEAFRDVRCNGYISKPVDANQISRELSHLRIPLLKKQRISFRCMGYFEVFLDGKPMKFENQKTKEFLAYLVDACGGICTNREITAHLWEDDFRHDSYFKKIRKDLIDTLAKVDCSDILYRQRGALGLNVAKVDCDYYEWRKTNQGKKKPDEYMTQYDWANVPSYEW